MRNIRCISEWEDHGKNKLCHNLQREKKSYSLQSSLLAQTERRLPLEQDIADSISGSIVGFFLSGELITVWVFISFVSALFCAILGRGP